MLQGKFALNLCLGTFIPGFPEKIDVTPENPAPEQQIPKEIVKIPHTIEFFEEDGVLKAIYTTPRGKQKIDKVHWSNYSAAWEAYAGSEGTELFRSVMILSESTHAVWGFTCGVSPLFRGYTPFEGTRISD